jgi:hypothetical protein
VFADKFNRTRVDLAATSRARLAISGSFELENMRLLTADIAEEQQTVHTVVRISFSVRQYPRPPLSQNGALGFFPRHRFPFFFGLCFACASAAAIGPRSRFGVLALRRSFPARLATFFDVVILPSKVDNWIEGLPFRDCKGRLQLSPGIANFSTSAAGR